MVTIKLMELCGYCGIALTIIGQITVGANYLLGQTCWLVANALFIIKAVRQKQGKAETIRNVIMLAITIGLIVAYSIG